MARDEGVWEKGFEGIFGPKREEVTGEWRKLHNNERNDLYNSPNFFGWLNQEEWDGRGM